MDVKAMLLMSCIRGFQFADLCVGTFRSIDAATFNYYLLWLLTQSTHS